MNWLGNNWWSGRNLWLGEAGVTGNPRERRLHLLGAGPSMVLFSCKDMNKQGHDIGGWVVRGGQGRGGGGSRGKRSRIGFTNLAWNVLFLKLKIVSES